MRKVTISPEASIRIKKALKVPINYDEEIYKLQCLLVKKDNEIRGYKATITRQQNEINKMKRLR